MVTSECVILVVCPPYLEINDVISSILRRHISLLFRQFPLLLLSYNLVAHLVGSGLSKRCCQRLLLLCKPLHKPFLSWRCSGKTGLAVVSDEHGSRSSAAKRFS